MKTSQEGIDLIKNFEGFRADQYKDSGNIATIGYGHALRPGESFVHISPEDAEKLLKEDVAIAERYIQRRLGYIHKQNEFDALVSFIFNIGVGAFEGSSVYKFLKLKEQALALLWWAKWIRDNRGIVMPGLVARREKEIRVFNGNEKHISEERMRELFPVLMKLTA